MTTLRGELRCFACSRYLCDFESHTGSGPRDLRLCHSDAGPLPQSAIMTERGLRCSHCGGRAVAENVDRSESNVTQGEAYSCPSYVKPAIAA